MLIICLMEGLSIMCSVHPVDSAAVRNLCLEWCRGPDSAPHMGFTTAADCVGGWLRPADAGAPSTAWLKSFLWTNKEKKTSPSVSSWAALALLSSTVGFRCIFLFRLKQLHSLHILCYQTIKNPTPNVIWFATVRCQILTKVLSPWSHRACHLSSCNLRFSHNGWRIDGVFSILFGSLWDVFKTL